MLEQQYSIRSFSRDLIEVLSRYDGNMVLAFDEALPVVDRFRSQESLTELGVPREGNHTPSSHWIYYDYELEVHVSTFEPGRSVPIHNHGTWELIAPCRGEFKYTSFRRIDDGTTPNFAELEAVDERILVPGDAAVCGPPPNDIHTFTPLSEDVLLLGMNLGPLAPNRMYFDLEAKTWVARGSKAWRLSQ